MNTPEGSATARRGGILELNAAILAAASVVGGKEREGELPCRQQQGRRMCAPDGKKNRRDYGSHP